jgi:hypothetical protein
MLAPGPSLALSFGAFPNADLFGIAVAATHGANLITNLAAFQAHAVRRSIDWEAPGCHVWTAPGCQGILARCSIGRGSHVFGIT